MVHVFEMITIAVEISFPDDMYYQESRRYPGCISQKIPETGMTARDKVLVYFIGEPVEDRYGKGQQGDFPCIERTVFPDGKVD